MDTVVVTGLGCITALGDNVLQFWDGLAAGRSGISPITGFDRELLRNESAGEIRLSPPTIGYAREAGISSRLELFATLAAEEALKQAGLRTDENKKIGIVAGVSLGESLTRDGIATAPGKTDASAETPDDLSEFADKLAHRFKIRGEVLIVSTACAGGTNAIGMARDMILHDEYDAVICGGADTLDRMKYFGHTALNTLTPTAIKPFAAERDGTIFGEGAALLVLESARDLDGRMPLAICSGAGLSCDAHHVTAPDPEGEGAIHAMREALRDARLNPEDIDYINLHGSGTVHNDAVECRAIGEVFGSAASSIPVSSVKSTIGHTMGAAGACEAVATVLSVMHQKVPPTVNTPEKDPVLSMNLVCSAAVNWRIEHALSNSFGFGGCNGTVVFSRWRNG